jgi:stage V sporulation protein G
MQITEVRVTLRDEAKLKGFANVTFDHAFVIRGMKIIAGKSGYFISMPSRRRPDGSHQDIAHPITAEMRRALEEAVLQEYQNSLENQPAHGGASPVPAHHIFKEGDNRAF